MPHAALWVVQPDKARSIFLLWRVSMPHAALWVVQRATLGKSIIWDPCFNAARGFVGGTAPFVPNPLHVFDGFNAARGFVGGAAREYAGYFLHLIEGFNAARGFVGGAATSAGMWDGMPLVSMPHAALWVVQHEMFF